MTGADTDPAHFARAVTALGDRRPVVARSAILNARGVKIIEKGTAIDTRLIERLMQHQLKQPLSEDVESEPSVSGTVLRQAAQALCAEHPLFVAMVADTRLRDVLFDELLLVPLPAPVAFQLTLLREMRPDAWLHALYSMVTAGWLAVRRGGTRYDVRILAAAGLVHDLGMLHLDPVLMQPELQLSPEQRRQLYSHPLVSVKLLERHHDYPRELLRAVLEHHETLAGTGYPRQIGAAAVSPWGRILAVTELTTAMFAPERSYPVHRLALALRLNRHRYDVALSQEVEVLLLGLKEEPPIQSSHDPVLALAEIEALLMRWPQTSPDALPRERDATLEALHESARQVLRSLADAGATSVQLAMVSAAAIDEPWRAELGLVVREMAWQLRALSRQIRHRWRVAGDEARPGWLQQFLDDADSLCLRLISG
jgi:hypothetical protein